MPVVQRPRFAILSCDASVTMTSGYSGCSADASGGPITITLPAVRLSSEWLWIKKGDETGNGVTIQAREGESIDEGDMTIVTENAVIEFVADVDALQWLVLRK